MTDRVSARLAGLPGSATLAMSARARELRAQGRDIISFAAGEPDFPTPEHILAAASRAIYDPANHKYSQNAGLPALREAIAENTGRFSGVEVDASQVIVTNGAKQAIFDICAALFDPGDEVLVPAPYWVTYPAAIGLAGATPVPVPSSAETGFKVTPDDLDRARTGATKGMILVSPNNPSGSVYSDEELASVAEWATTNRIWVISDEIYQRLAYSYPEAAPSIAANGGDLDRLVLVNGVAKSYAMTGWRVGWAIAPPDIVGAAERFQSHATGNVSNVSQQAAIAALTGPQDTVATMREAFDRRRRMMYELVVAIPGVSCREPEGAFYVFPNVEAHLGDRFATTDDLVMAILEDAGVATVSGESFGVPGHIRLSYATSEAEIERGMNAITELLASN
ncbi:MAG TPA: pyridoxal phosphate-dependent aminotransferase [Acidimicrobiia bacterium]